MLRKQLNDALKRAMKDGDQMCVATVRLMLAALKDRDIEARGKGNTDGISDDDILAMMMTMVRQRRESIELYQRGGRVELAEQEAEEIAIIERFLPRQLSEEETRAAVDETIAEIEASGLKDMGRTMAALKERFAGQMDMSRASAVVKEILS